MFGPLDTDIPGPDQAAVDRFSHGPSRDDLQRHQPTTLTEWTCHR